MGNPTAWLIARVLGVLELFVGLGAVVAGVALCLRPDGSLLYLSAALLGGTGFDSYLVPGVVLALIVGVPNFLAAILSLKRAPFAGPAAVGAGVILLLWMGVQMALIGYHFALQILYTGLGLFIAGFGLVLTNESSDESTELGAGAG